MKTFIFTLFCVYAVVLTADAQLLYGTTSDGGKLGGGTICTYNPATHALTAVKNFYVDGTSPRGNLTLAFDGKFYGLTETGGKGGSNGRSGRGTIFSYDTATGTYTQVATFDGINGKNPTGSLLQAADGKLYGVCNGGPNNYGEIFFFNPVTATITKVFDFDYTNGGYPYGSLMQATDGKIYGMTTRGGNKDGGVGVIFSFNPETSVYSKLHDFDYANGATPYGNLMQASDGKLYGMTSQAGSKGGGTIFSFDPLTSTFTNLHSFNYYDGANPKAGLIQASDGKLYGMTTEGGKGYDPETNEQYGGGVIFCFDLSAATYTKLHDFDVRDQGSYPQGNLIQAYDGNLYGMTSNEFGSRSYGNGFIFSYSTSDSAFTLVHEFDMTIGAHPYGSFVQTPNGRLYALASDGGTAHEGVIFSYDISSAIYKKFKDFGINPDGNIPYGSLCKTSIGKLYGITNTGGNYNTGVIFSFDPATEVYTKLYDFDRTNGAYPVGSLMQASNGKLYGMTVSGGSYDAGVIFSFDPLTATYTKLLEFNGTNGASPTGNLIQASDGKLYGMANNGGSHGYGIIFSYNLATSELIKLYDFDKKQGAYPNGSLIQAADGKLYGMTNAGGSYLTRGSGVIFSFDPSTATFTKKYNFEGGTEGEIPYGSLVQASDGKLYGMTKYGGTGRDGALNYGTIFSYNPSTSTYNKIADFDGDNGAYPQGDLVQASDGKLYAMTNNGGSKNAGVVFSYDIAADTDNYKKLADFKGDNGANPNGSFIEVFPCTSETYYRDADGDGYGYLDSAIQSCILIPGYIRDSTDCDDSDSTIHPGALELCDGKDNNCNGQVDENCHIPIISIEDAITQEGNSGYKEMHFYVSLDTTAYDTIRVHYSTVRSTATAQVDYVPTKGILSFTPGQQLQIITVLIKGDQQVELSELFKVQLSKPVGAVIGDGEGVGIIVDDDLKFNGDPTIAAGENTNYSIAVAPNPASNQVNVRLNGFKGNTRLQLFSPQGRLLKELKLQPKSISNQKFNVSDLPGGTYFLSAIDEKGHQQTTKLIITR